MIPWIQDAWLPMIFAGLMGLSMLIYVILDGYDLGVGMLMFEANEEDRDKMIASIGPFWDANETWLVLGVGILLVAFPLAHGVILTALYLPVAVMLGGLILRGVAFDFRAKAKVSHKTRWDRAFMWGSTIATLAQGYMLAQYVMGLRQDMSTFLFGVLAGIGLMAGYRLVGASWLIMKTEEGLQKKSIAWARRALWGAVLGIAAVSLVTPLMNARIFLKWFSFPTFWYLLPIPFLTGVVIVLLMRWLKRLPCSGDAYCWVPFIGSMVLFLLGFQGLAYSFYPYIVPDTLTIWAAASAPDSLRMILIGVMIVLPFILAYTCFAYRVFWGKVKTLGYD
jgi:cytochrome d ubiquinol oxidase subunit II